MADSRRQPTSLRMGILGAAVIAPFALVNPARAMDDVAVTAIAARDPARAQTFAAKHAIPTAHATYADLLADPEIDAVYVPLPNNLHAAWSIKALEAGKHVLCEKPLAANADEARAMAQGALASAVLQAPEELAATIAFFGAALAFDRTNDARELLDEVAFGGAWDLVAWALELAALGGEDPLAKAAPELREGIRAIARRVLSAPAAAAARDAV